MESEDNRAAIALFEETHRQRPGGDPSSIILIEQQISRELVHRMIEPTNNAGRGTRLRATGGRIMS